jgi:hypothetical protein
MKNATKREVQRILNSGNILHEACNAIGRAGVIGEERNRLILFLAGMTAFLDEPVSVLLKGSSSSGKSNLLKKTIGIFPQEMVISRASLSNKAVAHGKTTFKGKILYLAEHRGGKEAQLLLRLQQSEGRVAHEYTTVKGASRGTNVSERLGTPVVLTSTTDDTVFVDDENRFLSIWSDESEEQTLAVCRSLLSPAITSNRDNELLIEVWHEIIRQLQQKPVPKIFPEWLCFIAERLPAEQVRVRRDFKRFISLLQIIGLCSSRTPAEIQFSDYCIAHRILEKAFSSTVLSASEQEVSLVSVVERMTRGDSEGVPVEAIAAELDWSEPLVRKVLKKTIRKKLLKDDGVRRESNRKRYLPGISNTEFLILPRKVMRKFPALANCTFQDPITGKQFTLRTKP